jgi:hypothetical protein
LTRNFNISKRLSREVAMVPNLCPVLVRAGIRALSPLQHLLFGTLFCRLLSLPFRELCGLTIEPQGCIIRGVISDFCTNAGTICQYVS